MIIKIIRKKIKFTIKRISIQNIIETTRMMKLF